MKGRKVVRKMMGLVMHRHVLMEDRYVNPNTDHAYVTICKKRGVNPSSETLKDGTQAHWIGKKDAKKLILNFHGSSALLSITVIQKSKLRWVIRRWICTPRLTRLGRIYV
jgi:hypothetical protein